MQVVADASVLIHLSRIGRFHLIKLLFGNAVISPSVFEEVVEKGWGLPGASETEKAIADEWIKVVEVINKWKARELARKFKIQTANAETVQLALELKPEFVLADEEEIRRLVDEAGVKIRGCLGVLIDAVRNGFISVSEAKAGVEELRGSGYRMSVEILKNFFAILEGLEDRH